MIRFKSWSMSAGRMFAMSCFELFRCMKLHARSRFFELVFMNGDLAALK